MTETPRPLVAGNWKMNGLRAEGLDLARALATKAGEGAAPGCDVLVCPPATALVEVAAVLEGSAILLGAQDCHAVPSGAHTGDLGAEMLADAGCRFVIVGHSERRANHRESDAEVRAKAEAAHRAGLVAIVCVGESEAQRRSGAHLEVVAGQLEGSLPEGADAADTVLAYEPVWAIGTGLTANVAEVAEMHAHLRARLGAARADLRILYGGSVTPDNAGELLAVENVNGALVGGASLKADAFWGIVQSCA